MSIYTGKADLFDSLVMIHQVTDFSNIQIYAAHNDIIPLRIDSQKDLIPYYPYLISIMSSSKDDNGIRHMTINLSEKSYIDIDEEERLEWRLNRLKKYYRRCKRNHQPFDDHEAIRVVSPWDDAEEYEFELVKRVKVDGEKATYDGVHIPYLDEGRMRLFNDMVEAGYNEVKAWTWCFGWRRLGELNGNNDDKK